MGVLYLGSRITKELWLGAELTRSKGGLQVSVLEILPSTVSPEPLGGHLEVYELEVGVCV